MLGLLRDNEVNSFEIEEAEFQYYPCDGCDLVINKYNRFKNNWLYNDDYSYYIEAQQNSCKLCSSDISTSGTVIHDTYLYDTNKVVRPVIELNKSADITMLVS